MEINTDYDLPRLQSVEGSSLTFGLKPLDREPMDKHYIQNISLEMVCIPEVR